MQDSPPLTVRPYEPRDRALVRQLCCDTADRGGPVEQIFHDRVLFADLVTRYYTDYEPEATWVAESDGVGVGYLTGCFDTRRYWRIMGWRILPQACVLAVIRGVLCRRQSWALLRVGMDTVRRVGFRHGVPLDRYPAHLHINVRDGFRGQHVGHLLMEQFLAHARARRLAGVHLVTRGDNLPACEFFARMGFTILGRRRVGTPGGRPWQCHDVVTYGQRL